MELVGLQQLLAAGIEVTAGTDLPTPTDFHILVAGRPQRAHLTASPNLRALIVPFAGLPEETRTLLAEFPNLTVHNLHHNSAPTAEMAIALLLAAARFIVPVDRQFRRHDWSARYQPPPVMVLDGLTALILGYGAVGRRVGRVCQALGMRVLGVRRHAPMPGANEYGVAVFGREALHRLLPQANALVITLPHTAETEGMIGAAELALLPRGALLVNVGRGSVVDEAALYTALRSGALTAAGLDVWYRYPESREARQHTPPARLPFHELDNVVMSPHVGGAFGSAYTEQARAVQLATLLNAAAREEPMPNRIDLALGY